MNLDKSARQILKKLAQEKRIAQSHVVEELLLQAANDSHVLELKQKIVELEKRIKELEEENEKLRKAVETLPSNKEEKKLVELKYRVNRVIEKYGELKLVEFMKKVFKLSPTENLKQKAEQFVDEYFVSKGNLLISEELGLIIKRKPDVGILGWVIRKL
ncbi:hypothetical protein [Thermococcus barophilus]|uniref:hypothetical protein n=1 Tax=Thermococcus barophilus TaxID=55802 RepID=UPI0011AE201B|nr:hypothetical protein [Thermococcus barophilus]